MYKQFSEGGDVVYICQFQILVNYNVQNWSTVFFNVPKSKVGLCLTTNMEVWTTHDRK